MKHSRLPFCLCSMVLLVMQAPQLSAQLEPAQTQLEEVVVTATRRETTLQETPASISAFLGERLQDMGAEGFLDYARFVPGVSFTDLGPSRRKYTIRGVQTEIGAGDSAATVSQYLDEVPLTAFGVNQPDPNLYDIARVEVLRGPQGTLFGSSAMGGAVRTILNPANLSQREFGGELTYSNTDGGGTGYAINAMANLPVVEDQFALRFVVTQEQIPGYIDNPRLGLSDVNEGDRLTARVMALYEPTDAFSVSSFYLAQRTDLDGAMRTDVASGPYIQNTALLEPYQDDLDIFNLTANLNALSGTFTGVASFFDRDDTQKYIDQEFGLAFGFIGPLGAGAFADGDRDSEGVAYELRYASDFEGRVNFVSGAFYNQTEESSLQNLYDVNGLTQVMFPDAPAGAEDPVFEEIVDRKFTDKSLFANVSLDLSESWTLTTGARWFDVSYEFVDTITVPPQFLGAPPEIPPTILTADSSDVSLKFNLAWDVSETVMIYADASEGFRRGGTNIANSFRPFVPEAYDPDSLWSYELGMNSQWLDQRLNFHAAVYHIDWADAQLKTLLSGDNGFGGTAFAFGVVNVGDVQIDGAEFELTTLLGENWELGGTLGLTNAELAQNGPGADPLRGLKGDSMPGVPDTQASLYLQLRQPLANGMEFFFRGDISYLDERTTELRDVAVDANNQPIPTQPNPNYFVMDDYTLSNLRVGLMGQSWQAIVFATNLFNEDADQLFFTPFGQALAGQQKVPIRPLTIGITLKKQF